MSTLARLVSWIALVSVLVSVGFQLRSHPMLSLAAFVVAGLCAVGGLAIEYWEHIRRIRARMPWLIIPHSHDNMPKDSISDLEIAHKKIWDSFNEFEGYFPELKELRRADEAANTMARQRDQRFSLTERTPRAARRDMERRFLQARRNLYEALADFKTVLFWIRKPPT